MVKVILWIAATLALVAGCIGIGDGGVRASGVMRDTSGKPIGGALVFLDYPLREKYPESFQSRSDSEGQFAVGSIVAPGHYTIPLVVQMDGYKQLAVEIPTLSQNTVEITLAPVTSSANSTAKLRTVK